MPKNTEEFINNIKKGVDYSEINEEFNSKEKQNNLLTDLIENAAVSRKDLVSIITPTDNNGYKYLNGGRKMQRDILIKICIACEQDFETTSRFLKRFGFIELYARNKRDYIIIQGINEKKTVEQICNMLSIAGEVRL